MKKWIRGIAGILLLVLCSMSVCAEEVNDTDQASQMQNLDFEHFLTDLTATLKARYEAVSNVKFDIESSRMTAMQQAAAEWEIMGKYASASFEESDDLNEEYIRSSYMDGLNQQNTLNAEMSSDEFWELWDKGYIIRRNVLVELQHVYSEQVDAEALSANIAWAASDSAEQYTENQTLTAWQLQALVFAYHQQEGGFDGKPGAGTVLKMKQMQADLHISINGVVNEIRIKELCNALQKQGRTDVIEAANEKLQVSEVKDAQGNPYENPAIPIVNASEGIDVQNETEHTVITGETENR